MTEPAEITEWGQHGATKEEWDKIAWHAHHYGLTPVQACALEVGDERRVLLERAVGRLPSLGSQSLPTPTPSLAPSAAAVEATRKSKPADWPDDPE